MHNDLLLIFLPLVWDWSLATVLSYLLLFLLFACNRSQCQIHLMKLLGCGRAAVWDQVGVQRRFIFSVRHMANGPWPRCPFSQLLEITYSPWIDFLVCSCFLHTVIFPCIFPPRCVSPCVAAFGLKGLTDVMIRSEDLKKPNLIAGCGFLIKCSEVNLLSAIWPLFSC